MAIKVTVLILLFSSLCLFAQTKTKKTVGAAVSSSTADELNQHLSAAETYQLTGDLDRAGTENHAVIAIALQRLGFIALEEKDPKKAVDLLTRSVAINDNSLARASLAAAYMGLSENDKAIAEGQIAVSLDPKNVRAHQILASLYYTKGNYQAALPELEKVFQSAPDFEGGFLLGMTYLRLQQLERAKLLFEEIENVVTKKSAYLNLMFARAFEETDYPQEAEIQYKRAIQLNPKGTKIHFYYGYFLMQNGGSGRTSDAEREFRQELSTIPNDFYSYFFLGVIASGENDHQKAIQYLQKAVQLNPKIGQAYLFLGQSQLELGDTIAAERNLRRSIELDADAAKTDFQVRRAYFLLGRLLIKTGRKTESEKALAKARELQSQIYEQDRDNIKKVFGEVVNSRNDKPDIAAATNKVKKVMLTAQQAAAYSKTKTTLAGILGQAYNNLGVISVQGGDLEVALENFAAAAEWKPDLPGLDRNWGIVSFRLSKFEKAIVPLERQIKTNPKDDLIRRMLGVSYYFTKNYKQAAAILKPIELQITDDAELAYFYGLSLFQSNLNKEAGASFTRLIEHDPKNTQARFYAAQGFVFLGDYDRAVQEFRSVAALDPQMLKVHYNAGQTLIRLNRLSDAEREFRHELQLNPSDESSKYHLAYTLLERKTNLDEALSLLREAIAARYDYADARYQLGKILIEKGEINEAINELETAANIDPKKDYIHYQLSIAYRRVSRLADAERELKLFRELKAENRSEMPSGIGTKQNVP